MADKVHPSPTPTPPSPHHHHHHHQTLPVPAPPPPPPPPPSCSTYVIQIPKDQIYRVPPPENALRYKHYLSRPPKSRRTQLCCCFRFFFYTLFAFFLLLAFAAAVFYIVFRPESPYYAVDALSVKSFNLTSSSSSSSSSSSPISPLFHLTLSAHNPNSKIGIFYLEPSSVELHYRDLYLCNGVLPQFFQPSNNVTAFKTALETSALELTTSVHKELIAAEKSGTVPFRVNLRAAVKFKAWSVKTWTMNVKVRCDVTVDKLTAESKVLSRDCDYGVDVW